MYSIYADDVCIYSDVFALNSMKVLNPKLTMEDNAAGSLSMTLTPQNVGYNSIARLTTNISVQKDGEEIWAGRVLQEDKDFYNNRVFYCEGELAFFNDSSQPPAEYTGLSIRAYLQELIAIHNSKVPANRRFTIGAVTVVDKDYPTYYTNYEKTIVLINNLVKEYGGHFRIRKVNGVRYLDYLEDYPDTCSQVIQFGTNLIDFVRKWDSTEFATVLVPLGARLDDSPIEALDAYLTIESVNNGSLYIQSDSAVKTYGWIEKVVTWDDVTDPKVLLEKAKAYLTDIQFDNLELELSALDLHYLDVKHEAVKLLDEIRVISYPHGLDRLFPVTKLEIPLDNPDQTQFKMGDTVRTSLTSENNKISTGILQKIEGLPKAHTLLKEAQENATHIMNMATTGYITITKDEYGSDTLYISNVRDYTKATKLWKWNMNGLGYSKDGGKTYGLAITMDGSIVADFITAGVLNGDLIRAGAIQDVKKNNYWNLTTGEFRLSAYAKVGDSTVASQDDVKDLDNSFDQQKVFNRLTNNGQAQGIYLTNKKLYINAEYIATGVLSDSKGNVTFDLNNGKLTMKKGSINIGNGNFVVDEEGNLTAKRGTFAGTLVAAKGTFGGELTAATGNFKGVVQAEDFLDKYGNSMMNYSKDKFTAKYLDLYGITITNKYTGAVTFAVSDTGAITVNGNITMGAGSSINWSTVTQQNEWANPTYQLAYDANSTANRARNEAADAYDEASAAWSRANQAYYDRCTDENVFNVLTSGGTRFGIFSDSYTGRLYINANYIRSGTINADYVDLSCGYGGFCKGHGYDGSRTTYGAMMYGSNGPGWEPYVIVTNAGARMTGSGASIWVGSGAHASEEISVSSDLRIKNTISYNLDKYDAFFMALKPTRFKYNNGVSGRLHLGFIAQDVEQAMLDAGLTSMELAALIKDPVQEVTDDGITDFHYSIRYGEFIALNTHMIQKLYRMVSELYQQKGESR